MAWVVVRPFYYAADGINAVKMEVGAVADFLDSAAGLEREGFIEVAKTAEVKPSQEPEETNELAAEESAAEEPAVADKPKRGRK